MWGGAAALCFMSGVQNEDEAYKKSVAVQLHLFAWELPDTILVSQRVPRCVKRCGGGGRCANGVQKRASRSDNK